MCGLCMVFACSTCLCICVHMCACVCVCWEVGEGGEAECGRLSVGVSG